MPVATADVPAPSRLTSTSTSVSLVVRFTEALRMMPFAKFGAFYQASRAFATDGTDGSRAKANNGLSGDWQAHDRALKTPCASPARSLRVFAMGDPSS